MFLVKAVECFYKKKKNTKDKENLTKLKKKALDLFDNLTFPQTAKATLTEMKGRKLVE
jgi:hypothetical protein